jgi:REP element-mobilizing transposase RayT
MPRIRRRFLLDPAEIGVYHCINRCVRRAFLCGQDPVSGKDFEHRRQWIQDRMQFLAGQFGVDVLGFAVLSNHLHVVLRNRPDVVNGWSDLEVARRWWNVFPMRRDREGNAKEPTNVELQMIIFDPEKLAEIRLRLSSVSWFMRCLAERIARMANSEDVCRGSFWEGRYKCVPLLDESAVAACLAYVDLNPIRAQIAETPETSRFTSVYERIQALRRNVGNDVIQTAATSSVDELAASDPPPKMAGSDCAADFREACPTAELRNKGNQPSSAAWLSPFELSEAAEAEPIPSDRASNKGCLAMSFAEYLNLLDWTGRQLRADKRGAIPADLAPILERLQVSDEGWLQLMGQFSRMFRRAAGRPQSLQQEREQRGCQLMQGIRHSRAIFL